MQNRRLFSLIIKILLLIGVIVFALVLINSLFTDGNNNQSRTDNNEVIIVEMNTEGMQRGQIRKIRWQNREVAILLRQFPQTLFEVDTTKLPEKNHQSINPQTRSIKIEYFVYFNNGDSKNCPLHYAAGIFKDICSGNRFDEAGRDISGNLYAYKIHIPPHYFKGNTVVIGQWGE